MSRSSGVLIEVVDESDYEESNGAEPTPETQNTVKAETNPAQQTEQHNSTVGNDGAPSTYSSFLARVRLPSFFHSLSETRVYDPAAYHRLQQSAIPTFHTEARQAFDKERTAFETQPFTQPTRVEMNQLIQAAMTFLIPDIPITPQLADDEDAPVNVAPLPWQSHDVSIAAAQFLIRLAMADRFSNTDASSSTPSEVSPAMAASADSDLYTRLSSPHILDLLARHLPSIMTSLRSAMRSSNADAATPEWKGADRFPAPYIVCAIVAHAPPHALAAAIGDIMPLVLPLVDDHEMRFKLHGLQSLTRLVQVVPPSSWNPGSGSLLIERLKSCLSFRDRPIIAAVVPAFVQAHVTFFPPLEADRPEVMSELTRMMAASPNAATNSPIRHRLHAQASLLTTILHEATFFTLSPSSDNSFALFVYAQVLIPVFLYIGPIPILAQLRAILSLLASWATLQDPCHARTNRLAWYNLECLLHMRVVDGRLASAHLPALIETAAHAWLCGVEQRIKTNGRTETETRSQVQHPAASTILRAIQRLRELEPTKFEPIWQELATVPELQTLDKEIQANKTS